MLNASLLQSCFIPLARMHAFFCIQPFGREAPNVNVSKFAEIMEECILAYGGVVRSFTTGSHGTDRALVYTPESNVQCMRRMQVMMNDFRPPTPEWKYSLKGYATC